METGLSVMAGLVPGIQVLFCRNPKDVDARHKAGHDERMIMFEARKRFGCL